VTSTDFRLVPDVSEPLTASRRPVREPVFDISGFRFFVLAQAMLRIQALLVVVELEVMAVRSRRHPLAEHGARETPLFAHSPTRQPASLGLALHGQERHAEEIRPPPVG
jgi:hypothetical protein